MASGSNAACRSSMEKRPAFTTAWISGDANSDIGYSKNLSATLDPILATLEYCDRKHAQIT